MLTAHRDTTDRARRWEDERRRPPIHLGVRYYQRECLAGSLQPAYDQHEQVLPASHVIGQMTEFEPKSYWESRLGDEPGLAGVGYLGLGRPFNEWAYRVRRRVYLRTLRQLGITVRDAELFEIGAGTGYFTRLWRQL